jgi:hypothetical protein
VARHAADVFDLEWRAPNGEELLSVAGDDVGRAAAT